MSVVSARDATPHSAGSEMKKRACNRCAPAEVMVHSEERDPGERKDGNWGT